MIQIMNITQYTDLVLKKKGNFLVKFESEQCMPCKMLTPILEDLEEKYGDMALFVKVDADMSPDIVNYYGVMSVPMVLLVSNGQVEKSFTGYQNKQYIEDILKSFL